MAFIGSTINLVKGLLDTFRIHAEENALEQSLKEFESMEGYLAGLGTFERLLAKDELLIGQLWKA